MNPLTKRATENLDRENDLIAWTCGLVLSALVIAFLL